MPTCVVAPMVIGWDVVNTGWRVVCSCGYDVRDIAERSHAEMLRDEHRAAHRA